MKKLFFVIVLIAYTSKNTQAVQSNQSQLNNALVTQSSTPQEWARNDFAKLPKSVQAKIISLLEDFAKYLKTLIEVSDKLDQLAVKAQNSSNQSALYSLLQEFENIETVRSQNQAVSQNVRRELTLLSLRYPEALAPLVNMISVELEAGPSKAWLSVKQWLYCAKQELKSKYAY